MTTYITILFTFQILACQRSLLAANEMARSLVVGIDRRQLEIASEEVSWLTMPDDVPGKGTGEGFNADAPLVLQVGGKNKDGNGNKRKNRSPSVTMAPESATSPTSDYHSQNGGLAVASTVVVGGGGSANHFNMVEEFVAAEDAYLNGVFDLMAQVPGLLGKTAVRFSSKSKATLSRTGKIRMSEYYHDLLWQVRDNTKYDVTISR